MKKLNSNSVFVTLLLFSIFLSGCASAEKTTGRGTKLAADYPASIRKVINGSSSEFQKCYQASLKQDPKLAGKITLNWEITESGTPSHVKVVDTKSTISAKDLQICCVRIFEQMKFEPIQSKLVEVTYPLRFSI